MTGPTSWVRWGLWARLLLGHVAQLVGAWVPSSNWPTDQFQGTKPVRLRVRPATEGTQPHHRSENFPYELRQTCGRPFPAAVLAPATTQRLPRGRPRRTLPAGGPLQVLATSGRHPTGPWTHEALASVLLVRRSVRSSSPIDASVAVPSGTVSKSAPSCPITVPPSADRTHREDELPK